MELSNLSSLQTLILQSLLSERLNETGSHILDNPEIMSQAEKSVELRNVCAKVCTELADQIDEVCAFLGVSKRRFLEAAMLQALDTFSSIKSELGGDQ